MPVEVERYQSLHEEARRLFGIDQPIRVHGLTDGHHGFLPWHRERVFRKGC